ncbi:hydroxysqualene dehydroxylase HpnE [Paenacidovorax monticola]|uniref:FAD-dependent oxidoreductase n=1 Tax=Paenacidovorax monticola TaxID=1926868 RepID=A0A7H0HG69_9BURK|nr:hydroxysqualene dehydroxylase HpnE [Paenacidovorax monticola]QNP59535.1 FAD-dependent oxidoreductase [Paenacidovorax monticola]
MKVAIVGAGWAGLAAAIAAVQAGAQATVFEAARTLGGRARALQAGGADGTPLTLDNGQHILIGAYTESLRLMRLVGVDPAAALHRQPLALEFPDATGLRLPDLPPPWDALVGIARARGWGWRDKAALLRTAAAWRLAGFRCAPQATVEQLCAPLTRRLIDEFIDPLCVSALNTPAREASGSVFLRVLQDSLFSGRGGSHLLLPRTDLGALFPEAAARWLQARGAQVHTGRRVQAISTGGGAWRVDGEPFDTVLLATPSTEAARLARTAQGSEPVLPVQDWITQAEALRFIPITTVYAQAPRASGPVLPGPMLALRPEAGQPAQFVFDRGRLGGPAGLLAFVVSASEADRARVEAQVLAQARSQLGLEDLQPLQTVVEKRATFACTPGLQRPRMALAPGLWACGDYTEGPYPATLEGAVLSGGAAARLALA